MTGTPAAMLEMLLLDAHAEAIADAEQFPDFPRLAPRFAICDEKTAGWYLNRVAAIEGEEARVKAQAAAILQGLAADRERLAARFESELHEYVVSEIQLRYQGKKRSLPLLQGTVSLRTVPASVRIADKAAALAYAVAESPELVLTETVTTTTLDSAGYRKLFEATGDADMPGIEIIPARESMTIKFPNDAKETTK